MDGAGWTHAPYGCRGASRARATHRALARAVHAGLPALARMGRADLPDRRPGDRHGPGAGRDTPADGAAGSDRVARAAGDQARRTLPLLPAEARPRDGQA